MLTLDLDHVVLDGMQGFLHRDLLVRPNVDRSKFHSASGHQDAFYGPQAEVVVSTVLELLVQQLKESRDLVSQVSCISEAIAVQDDLSDDCCVRYTHCYLTEKGCQIVW